MSGTFECEDADMPALPAGELRTADTGDLVANAGQGLTKRQYAAIHLRVPMSGDEWLDEMIFESQRRDASFHAAAGILASNSDRIQEEFWVSNKAERLSEQLCYRYKPFNRPSSFNPTTHERT